MGAPGRLSLFSPRRIGSRRAAAIAELGCSGEHNDGCPDHGSPEAKRQEHCRYPRSQLEQMEGGLREQSQSRLTAREASALEQNSAVHRPSQPAQLSRVRPWRRNAALVCVKESSWLARSQQSPTRGDTAGRARDGRKERRRVQTAGNHPRRSAQWGLDPGRTPNPVSSYAVRVSNASVGLGGPPSRFYLIRMGGCCLEAFTGRW
jgi:hypothetical protein